MHFDHYMNGGSMWGGMWIFWILIIVGIGVVFYFINSNKNTQDETPLKILKKRYAQGEITKEEFEKMREDIEN